jgi:hypothetical protein
LEHPSQVFLRLCRESYYRDIFLGLKPREPVFDIDRRFGPIGSESILSYERFRSTWLDPGFVYHDFEPYFVNKDKLVPLLTTGLGWDFRGSPPTSDHQIWTDWVRNNPGFLDRSVEHLEDYLSGGPLHNEVAYRLPNYFESDVYVFSLVDTSYDRYIIITKDIRLCLRIHNFVNSDAIDHGASGKMIYAVDPLIYATGRMEGDFSVYDMIGQYGRTQEIVDQGSLIHCDFTEFLHGMPTTVSFSDLFGGDNGEPPKALVKRPSRYNTWIEQIVLPRTHEGPDNTPEE